MPSSYYGATDIHVFSTVTYILIEYYDASIANEMKLLLEARKKYAYGRMRDCFFDRNCIGWVRAGDSEHPGSAVVITDGDARKGCFLQICGKADISVGSVTRRLMYTLYVCMWARTKVERLTRLTCSHLHRSRSAQMLLVTCANYPG